MVMEARNPAKECVLGLLGDYLTYLSIVLSSSMKLKKGIFSNMKILHCLKPSFLQ